ncbi:formin-like protein 18 [Falco naumanni]|uniref:formin-like protein 18 n=1 Tax=Falco naumanni TaxID=148594 RepID=UPI001ADE0CD5|nr:formin-like protein 18 [Falco naumanni]
MEVSGSACINPQKPPPASHGAAERSVSRRHRRARSGRFAPPPEGSVAFAPPPEGCSRLCTSAGSKPPHASPSRPAAGAAATPVCRLSCLPAPGPARAPGGKREAPGGKREAPRALLAPPTASALLPSAPRRRPRSARLAHPPPRCPRGYAVAATDAVDWHKAYNEAAGPLYLGKCNPIAVRAA